jgi:hypothetical protein
MQPGVGVVTEIVEVLVERNTTAGTVADAASVCQTSGPSNLRMSYGYATIHVHGRRGFQKRLMQKQNALLRPI